ncbi:15753_t:CDS:2 [Acaulospora colombiana]|uniref:15753_t:CDS:1 n=1 Tax=Acaulospora colombiana TaxID=27376 RepID=A0ACA9JXH6_9GLOM|nr:15753_t:CDS:2 [Acaulospora colombiana]
MDYGELLWQQNVESTISSGNPPGNRCAEDVVLRKLLLLNEHSYESRQGAASVFTERPNVELGIGACARWQKRRP